MTRKLLAAAVFFLTALQIMSQGQPPQPYSSYVDADGRISRPTDYRKEWVHLGTYFVQGETPDGDSMHSVYTEQRSVDAYQSTGEWPDGATLVKEVMSTSASDLTTGRANWADQPKVWFVAVKDREGRFPENPLWGDGWGWALFEADQPEVQAATDYRRDCLACHEPARATDLVYVQGYPILGMRRRPERARTNTVSVEQGAVVPGAQVHADLALGG